MFVFGYHVDEVRESTFRYKPCHIGFFLGMVASHMITNTSGVK